MGRPFDWTLVSMAAVVLGVARMLAAGPAAQASAPAASEAVPDPDASPFAYIREDGTEDRVPATGPAHRHRTLRVEDVLPVVRRHADNETGDRVWTPIARVERIAR